MAAEMPAPMAETSGEEAPQAEPEAAPAPEQIVAEQQPVEEPAAPAPVQPEPEPVAVVLTPPDPDRPKRAGWWSKAKSVLSGS